MSDGLKLTMSILLFVFMGYVFGLFMGNDIGKREMQREAIERGYAIRHPKTGNFTWIQQGTNDLGGSYIIIKE